MRGREQDIPIQAARPQNMEKFNSEKEGESKKEREAERKKGQEKVLRFRHGNICEGGRERGRHKEGGPKLRFGKIHYCG